MTADIQELRSKMVFHAYDSKDLDAIETAFIKRFGGTPKAFMTRSPFMIRGRIENKKKLVLSSKHCGYNSVFVPLILDKESLERTIHALGEVSRMVYVDRRKIDADIRVSQANKENQRRTYEKHCTYCGKKYMTDVVNPTPTCGSSICAIRHKEYLEVRKELNAKSAKIGKASKIDKSTRMPEINLDSPSNTTFQGYVYCIRAENGLFKIGRSDDVEHRFASLRTMSPVDVYLEHTVFSDNYVMAEEYAHKELDQYRHHGEWFDLPENIYNWFISLDNYDLDIPS